MKKQKSARHNAVLAWTIVIPLLIGSAVSPQAAEQFKLEPWFDKTWKLNEIEEVK
jgi:hypothetical protein